MLFTARLASAQLVAPGILSHTSNTTSSINWVWDDNTPDPLNPVEQGFSCYTWYWGNIGTASSGYIRGSKVWEVPANITSYTETGLATNTSYKRVVVAWKEHGVGREESPAASWDSITGNYYYGPTYARSATPTASPPAYLVSYYTSIQSPAGLSFGPKGMNDLTVNLKAPLPSNVTAGGSGFYIENVITGGNLSSPIFYNGLNPLTLYNPAPPITGGSGWWKHNGDYDPLPSMTGISLGAIYWDSYFKNGTASYNSSNGQYTSSHAWNFWASENLDSNTPYRFRAKARNGDGDETAWCDITGDVWTLPKSPDVVPQQPVGACYDIGTRFTFVNNSGWGIGNLDHYHIVWSKSAYDVTFSESDTKWAAGDLVLAENNPGHYYLHVISHNSQNEEPVTYKLDGTMQKGLNWNGWWIDYVNTHNRNVHTLTYGPFQIGYDIHGKVTISGGTGSYTDVTVYAGGRQTNCDSLGKYSFLSLPPGTYDVYAELAGYRIAVPVTNNGHYSIKLPPDPPTSDNVTRDIDFVLAYSNTYTIAGRVSLIGGPNGFPADVTRIKVHRGLANPITAYPDQYGNFYFPGVFAGTYVIWYELPAADPDYQYYVITSPSGGRYTVSVGPDATGRDFVFNWEQGQTVSISGLVNLLGGSGEVTSATVYCRNLTTGLQSTTVPNTQGRYIFENFAPGKDYELRVSMAGYKTTDPVTGKHTLTDVQNNASDINFTLEPVSYYSVRGRVNVSEGIIRAPDVKVHCDNLADPDIAFSVHPDNDGNYIFNTVPEGEYKLYVEIPEGYKVSSPSSGRYEPLLLGPSATEKNFTVDSLGTYRISGNVKLQGGTVTPREAMVVCSYYNSAKDEYINYSVMPNSLGNYEFTGLVPATYTLSVSLRGYITIFPSNEKHTVTVTRSDVKDKNFILATFSILGKVRFNTSIPEPITNVTLICTAVSTNPDVPHVYIAVHPDSAGNYAIYNLLPTAKVGNPYRVEAVLAGCGVLRPDTGYYDITITNRNEEREFVMGSYTVSGKVSIHQGTADLSGATIVCSKLNQMGGDEIESLYVNPKSTGEYVVSSVEPGSYYRVRVKMQGYVGLRPKEDPPGTTSWGYEKWVPPSQANLDFLMVSQPTHNMYSISGRVTMSDGTVTPDRVVVHCGDINVYPDSAGDFVLKNLNAGTYDLWVERRDYHTTFPTTNQGHYFVVVGESAPVVTGMNFTLALDPVPTYDISGTVTLQGGTGNVADAWVYCGNKPPKHPNAAGQFTFTGLAPANYELWVELDRYQTIQPGGTGRQVIRIYDRDVSAVDFTLKAIPVYAIEGVVTLPYGGDVTQVEIHSDTGKPPVTPDMTGRYRIEDLLAGTYKVWAAMANYVVTHPRDNLYTVKVGPDSFDNNFTLVRYYTISGRVSLSGGTGDVMNAVVTCGNLKTSPDASGFYEFTNLSAGNYPVYVTMNGYETSVPVTGIRNITLGPDAPDTDFTMTATVLLSVSGRVRVLRGNAAESEVLVSAGGVSTNPSADGSYTLSGLSPGSYDLTAQLAGYTVVSPSSGKYRITLDRKDISGYNFDFDSYSISGNIKLSGGTADVTTVVITCQSPGYNCTPVTPNSSGDYIFQSMPAGEYTVTANLVNYGVTSPAAGQHTVKVGPDAKNVNFIMATYSIEGKVSFWGAAGNMAGVTVSCQGVDGTRTSPVDSNGRYLFTHIPAGAYRITVNLNNYTVISPREGYRDISVYSNMKGIDFTLTAYTISGKATLWQSPGTVTGVTITIQGPAGTINPSVAQDGSYNSGPLLPGTYTVAASMDNHTVISPKGGGVHTVKISPSVKNVNFTLAAYKISGTVKVLDYSGPAGTVVYCEGQGVPQQFTVDASGKFYFYPLQAGQYRLWAARNGYDVVSPSGGEYILNLTSWTAKDFTLKKR